MKTSMVRTLQLALAAGCVAAATAAQAASFSSPNNLVVVRLGDGSAGSATAAQSVHLDEYTVGGVPGLVQSIDLAASGGSSLTLPGVSNHDGLLNRSVDGKFLLLTGYRADAGSVDPSTLSASAAPRVVGLVGASGVANTTTALTSAYQNTSIRGAASVDGSSFWVAGDNAGGGTPSGGLRYVASVGASTSVDLSQVQVTGGPKTPDNVRSVGIFGGQLYDSSGSSSSIGKAVFKVGSGLPTSGSQTLTTLTTDGQSTNAFFFADLDAGVPGVDTLYTSTSVSDLRKYSLVGGAWTLNGVITGPGLEAMTAAVSGSTVALYVSNGSTIKTVTDSTGYNGAFSGSLATILTAGANQSFRGLAFAPAVPEPASAALAALGMIALAGSRGRRNA